MPPVGACPARPWSVGSGRVVRVVCASVLATGVAAVAFSHLPQEPASPAREAGSGKSFDRLLWEVEEVPTRATRTFDSVAMFALPMVEPRPWSERAVLARAPEPVAPARSAQFERREREAPRVAALPPSRPAPMGVAPAAAAGGEPLPIVQIAAAKPVRDGLHLLGWHVPGTDRAAHLLPDGGEVMRTAARLGGKASGLAQAVAEAVGLD